MTVFFILLFICILTFIFVDGFLGAILIIGMLIIGIVQSSDDRAAIAKKRADELEQRKIPHVIREADGCKVYSFYANNSDHYFTRCENSTTSTERNYTVQRGKSTHSEKEIIDASN